jgi:hypothetical protein
MDPTSDSGTRPNRRSHWRCWLFRGLCALALLISIPFAMEFYARWQARLDLEKTIAELDRTNPRWRIDDIHADRNQVPPDKNSAFVVAAAKKLLPTAWKSELEEELSRVAPPRILRQDQVDRLIAELHPLQTAVEKARELRDLPQGRINLLSRPDFFSGSLLDWQGARQVATLLNLDVARHIQLKQMEDALNSNRAMVNAGRSLGDEPGMIPFFYRLLVTKMALLNLERILAQCELKGPQLEECQDALREESDVPLFLLAMRGERAGNHNYFNKLEKGELPILQTLAEHSRNRDGGGEFDSSAPFAEFFAFSRVLRAHVVVLVSETKAIEAARLPLNQRYREMNNIAEEFRDEFWHRKNGRTDIAELFFPPVGKLAREERLHFSHIACATAGIEAERFRVQQGRWPESMVELVKAGFLNDVPIDFVDGKPLSFRHTADGIVIYSKDGRYGKYDGTALDERPDALDIDFDHILDLPGRVEFRLWDVAHRRQASRAKAEDAS